MDMADDGGLTGALVPPKPATPHASLGRRLAAALGVLYCGAVGLRAYGLPRAAPWSSALEEQTTTAPADVCLVSVAAGAEYVAMAQFAGLTKAGYAAKWGYRYAPYDFDDADAFMDFCRASEFGSQFGDALDTFTVTLLKFCTMAHALNEGGCAQVFVSDADSLITNWDQELTWAWNGAHASPQKHIMFTLVTDTTWGDGFCPGTAGADKVAAGSCGDFGTFWNCLNTGTLLADDSAYTLDFLAKSVRLQLDGRQAACSTNPYLPDDVGASGHDQCPDEDDQCVAGCVVVDEATRTGVAAADVAVPDEFACATAATRPAMQESLMVTEYIERLDDCPELETRLDADAFNVNCIAMDEYKATCLLCAADYFASTRDIARSLSQDDLDAILAIYPRSYRDQSSSAGWDGLNS
jgi:hypothetical protein